MAEALGHAAVGVGPWAANGYDARERDGEGAASRLIQQLCGNLELSWGCRETV